MTLSLLKNVKTTDVLQRFDEGFAVCEFTLFRSEHEMIFYLHIISAKLSYLNILKFVVFNFHQELSKEIEEFWSLGELGAK